MTIIITNIIMYVICSEVTLRGWQDIKIQELIPIACSLIEIGRRGEISCRPRSKLKAVAIRSHDTWQCVRQVSQMTYRLPAAALTPDSV